MGIPRGVARLLLDEHRRRPFSGSVLELGRMTVYATREELETWAREQGVALQPGPSGLSHVPALAAQGCLDDRSFFRLLGFTAVTSADASPWEGADLILDLNQPVPDELAARFDLVFEAGTIQHVFHLPAVLANVHRLLRPGGRVIHGMAPSTNHVDHGFYMFSPTLFHDWYTANRWRLEEELFFTFRPYWHRGRFHSSPWAIRRYLPGCLDAVSYGGLGADQMALFVVATRTPEATAGAVPQQGWFTRFWPEAERAEPGPPLPRPSWRRLLDRPALLPLVLSARRLQASLRRRRRPRLPPVVARY